MRNYNDFKGRGIPVFPENSRVCFLGDSLTGNSLWVELVFAHYLKTFPKSNIKIYDCGVGGGTAEFGYDNLDADLYTFDPTHVVIMYGHNDINQYSGTPLERAEQFYSSLRKLAQTLMDRGITVYLMTEPDADCCGSDAVQVRDIASVTVQSVAADLGLPCSDMFNMFKGISTDDIIGSDRVHLSQLGQCVFAKAFLHSQGFDGFTPDDDGFAEFVRFTPEHDHRWIINNKLRCIWLAICAIPMHGETDDEIIDDLRARIITRCDGNWDDFLFYLAINFMDYFPNRHFYREMLDLATDNMVMAAAKG